MSLLCLLFAFSLLSSAADAPNTPPETLGQELNAADVTIDMRALDDDEEEEQQIDPEEVFTNQIRQKLSEIIHGQFSYDGEILKIHYDNPEEIRNDYEHFGRGDPSHIEFRENFVRGKKGPDGIYCFQSHTGGGILLHPHFEDVVRIEVEMQFQWVESKSHFLMLVHASPTEFLASDYGVIPVQKRPKKSLKFGRAQLKEHNRSPSKWVDKVAPRTQSLEVDEDGKLTLSFESSFQEFQPSKPPTGGRVGLLWNDVRFVIHEIRIEGKLDRKWAAKEFKLEAPSKVDSPKDAIDSSDSTPGRE